MSTTTTTSTPAEDPVRARRRWRAAGVSAALALVAYVLTVSEREDGALSGGDLVRALFPAILMLSAAAVTLLPPGHPSEAWRRYAGFLLVLFPAASTGALVWLAQADLEGKRWWIAFLVLYSTFGCGLVAKRWREYAPRPR